MIIDKDTKLFCSFSKKAGSMGCKLFNTSFRYHNINAIYKSFSVTNIGEAINAVKCLGISGFAVSMPFKIKIVEFLDKKDDIVKKTSSCNTVVIKDSKLFGYNTDYMAVKKYLEENIEGEDKYKIINILGNGGYSKTVQKCCEDLNFKYTIIIRENWEKIKTLKSEIIFNCTPVEKIIFDESNLFIDCINTSKTGKILAMTQAALQYELYTNKKFPLMN